MPFGTSSHFQLHSIPQPLQPRRQTSNRRYRSFGKSAIFFSSSSFTYTIGFTATTCTGSCFVGPCSAPVDSFYGKRVRTTVGCLTFASLTAVLPFRETHTSKATMLRNIRSLPPRKATLLPVRQRYATPVDPSLERIYGGVCLPSPLQRAGYNNVLEVFQEADQASMERFLAEDYWAWHHERGELAFYPPGSRGIEAAITRASEEVILEALNAPDGGPGYSWWLGQSLIYGQDISHKLEVMKARLRKALQYGMGRLNIPEYIHELAHSLKRAAEHEVVGQVKQEEVDEATASIDTHKLNQIGGRTTEAASDSNSETTERSSSGEHHVAGRTRSVTEATGSVLDDFTFAGFDDDADSVHPDNFQDQPMSDSEVDESAITPRVTRSATKNDTREAENAKAEAIASKSTASSSTRNSNPRQVNIEVIVPTRIINSLSSTFLSSSPSSSVPTTTDVASNFDPNEQKLKDRSNVSSTAGKMGNVQSSPSRRVSKNRNKKDRHSQSEEKNQSLSSSSTKGTPKQALF